MVNMSKLSQYVQIDKVQNVRRSCNVQWTLRENGNVHHDLYSLGSCEVH